MVEDQEENKSGGRKCADEGIANASDGNPKSVAMHKYSTDVLGVKGVRFGGGRPGVGYLERWAAIQALAGLGLTAKPFRLET
jgi:hypothetical protein